MKSFTATAILAAFAAVVALIGLTPGRDIFASDDVQLDGWRPGKLTKVENLPRDEVEFYWGLIPSRIHGNQLTQKGDVICKVNSGVEQVIHQLGEPDETEPIESGENARTLIYERNLDFRLKVNVRNEVVYRLTLESKCWLAN